MSGWRTKGYHSCYTCNDEPYSEALESKIGFINHRAYLPMEHRWRHSRLHNGLSEKRKRSLELQVGKIQEQLDKMPNIILGKHPSNKKRQLIGEPNWSKLSILNKLPYWKNKKLKHNIDVMHVEKNISESTYGTLLGIEGRNKDTDKARIDLQNMNFRHTLHLKQRPDGSYDKPRAFFSLSPNERDGFYDFLKSVKYPDGYAANISRSVNAKNGRLSGLKSHDCHVLLQRILPIGLRGFAHKDISIVLFELGSFFQDLCSRTLKRSELEKLEERIVLILCKLERFFPPAFFDVMHVEKNISESTYGTLLGIKRRNKDTDKARIDLQNINFRHTLHLKQRPDGSYDKPRAFFSLSPTERDGFYDFFKSVKYLDGYTANISRSVNAKNGRLSSLKSHDCHVLLQRILPIGLRGFAHKDISIVLFELQCEKLEKC